MATLLRDVLGRRAMRGLSPGDGFIIVEIEIPLTYHRLSADCHSRHRIFFEAN